VNQLGTSQVEGNERSDHTKPTTSLANVSTVVTLGKNELGSRKNKEGDCQEAEQGNVDNSGAKCCEEEDEGNDSPGKKVDAETVVQVGNGRRGGADVSFNDTESRNEDDTEGHPESTIRGESRSTESVVVHEFPHSSTELSKTSIEQSKTNNNVRNLNVVNLSIVKRENQSCQGKAAET